MTYEALSRFDNITERLKRQQPFGIASFAFLTSIVGNNVRHKKYDASYAGHAIDLSIRAVQSSLVLFCDRHWDCARDAQSIPKAISVGGEALELIIERHQSYFKEVGAERDSSIFRAYYDECRRESEILQSSDVRVKIRVIRSEQLAHLLERSSDRIKALRDDPDFDLGGVTVDSLLEFTKKTVCLSERVVYLRELLSPGFDERVKNFSDYYDRFWDGLPVFSEVEAGL